MAFLRAGQRFRLVLLTGILSAQWTMAADPRGPVARLGSDRFRQANPVDAIVYSPDGKQLATTDGDHIRIWEAADGRCIRNIHLEKQQLRALAFAADRRTLFAATYSDFQLQVRRIDPVSGKVLSNQPIVAGKVACGFSPDGRYLAFIEDTGTLAQVVDTSTGKAVVSQWSNEHKHKSFGLGADGKVVALTTRGNHVRLYDTKTGKSLHEYQLEDGPVAHMTFSPDGNEIVASVDETESSHLIRFDAVTGKIRWRHKTSFSNRPIFVADGSQICYFGADPSARTLFALYWLDAMTGKRLPHIMIADYRETALRPDGKVLATGGLDGMICQYDLKSRTRLDEASADPPMELTEVHVSVDGSKVRAWGDRWYEWDLKTGTQARLTPRVAPSSPGPYAVSGDQRWVVTPVGEQSRRIQRVEIVELGPGGQVHPLPADEPPYSFRFTANGRLMISKSTILLIVDPGSGKLLQEIRAGENE